MKKNKILRLASVMLMLCLITTCAISGTFAKYTTDGTAEDTARVAKWGVTVNVTGADLFTDEYNGGKVSADADVVAPGTAGTLAGITISGSPEVAVNVKFAATLELGDKWTTTGTDVYCPIVFTVGTTEYKIDGTTIKTVAELETAVQNAINAISATFPVGTPITTDALIVKWSWAQSVDDAKDTILGNAFNAEIDLDIVITVEQAF